MTACDAVMFGRICERWLQQCTQLRRTIPMDYVKPAEVAATMVETGRRKLALPTNDLIIRGELSGAILGVATSLAFYRRRLHRATSGRRPDLPRRADHHRIA